MPIELTDASRAAFEAWAKSPPFEWDTARYPDDPEHYAWPGGYRSHVTLCGWEAWQAGIAAGIERAAKVCEDDIGISAAAIRELLK